LGRRDGCSAGCSDGSCGSSGSGGDGPPPLSGRSAAGGGATADGGDGGAPGPWVDRTTPNILHTQQNNDI